MSRNLWIKMANLVFELEKKLGGGAVAPSVDGARAATGGNELEKKSGRGAVAQSGDAGRAATPAVTRNLDRMKAVLEESGLLLLNPAGEPYSETRTDLEASITGDSSGALFILDVIKPIIYSNQEGSRSLVQKGVVIVGNK